jgi:tRNA(Ile)-lysidine synthase
MPVRSSPRAPAPNGAITNAAERPLNRRFAAALAALGLTPAKKAALAVSGGGDSVALMTLYADWAGDLGARRATALIVDHGLRPNSSAEAALAANWAEARGMQGAVLPVRASAPRGNIEDWARDARYSLMGEWCRQNTVEALLVAHTLDDQAETLLIRLGRGSGVDGLSAMAPSAAFPIPGFAGVRLFRPLLGFGRAELRSWLAAAGTTWLEDPMNWDSRFARTRIRALLPLLEEAGIPVRRVAAAASHLARARDALAAQTAGFLSTHARFEGDGRALLDGAALRAAEREIGLRVLCAAVMRVSGKLYRPRFERLERLLGAIDAGDFAARTLSGCRVGRAPKARARFGPATLLIVREPARKRAKTKPAEPISGPPAAPA